MKTVLTIRIRFICCIFFILNALTIPFSWFLFSFQQRITETIYSPAVRALSKIFDLKIKLFDFSSDTKSLLTLICINLLVSVIICIPWKWKSKKMTVIIRWSEVFLTVYLSVVMMKYGFDKIFKTQFPLPEPNLLYTNLGNLDKDILYWSTIGSSRTYNIIIGLLEVLPALLILFNRIKVVGLLILFGVLIHVISINFSYDISVKFYSIFLFAINLFLLSPFIRVLCDFFILQKRSTLQNPSVNLWKIKPILIVLIGTLVFIEVLMPFIQNRSFNDDNSTRMELHGAYLLSPNSMNLRRMFIHRDSYIIFENDKEEMSDFKFSVNPIKNQMILTDYDRREQIIPFEYNKKSRQIILHLDSNIILTGRYLDWRKLPLLQSQFHWTVD